MEFPSKKRKETQKVLCFIAALFFVFLSGNQYVKAAFAETEVPTASAPAAATATAPAASEVIPTDTGKNIIITDRFDVRLEYGMNGILKNGTTLPVSIKVTNLGEDFEGAVRIIIRNNSYSSNGGVAYEKDLVLAAGASKTVSLTANCFGSNLMEIGVEIVDQKEKQLLYKLIQADVVYNDSILVGVLSNDFTALNYLDGINGTTSVNTGQMYYVCSVVELSAENLPESSSSLAALNYLVINSFDTSTLSQAQYQAIQEWVSAGGILIIGTGPDYKQTLSLFTDGFLEGQLGNEAVGNMELHYIDESQQPVDRVLSLNAGDGVYSISITGGTELNGDCIQYEDGLSLLQKKALGRGAVVVAGFNLGLDPIDTWDGKANFGYALLKDSQTSFTETVFVNGIYTQEDRYNSYSVTGILEMLFDVKVPNIALYALFFLIYVLVAGPVGYLILKAIDKREAIWGVIPGCAALFTVLIAILSIPSRITEPVASHLTVLDMQNGIVQEKVYMAIQTPDTKQYKIQLAKGYSNFSPVQVDDYSYFGNTDNVSWDYRLKETTEGYNIYTNHKTSFTTDYMTFEKVDDAQNRSFDIQIQGTLASFSGSVTNHTGHDLTSTVICYYNKFVYLGDLKDGETKTFSDGENVVFYPHLNGWNLMQHAQLQNSSQQRLIEYTYDMICGRYNNTLNYNEGFVMGYIDHYNPDIVQSENISENGAAIAHQYFTCQPEDVKGTYIDSLFSYVVNPNYDLLDYDDGMMYATVVDSEFNVLPVVSVSRLVKGTSLSGGWSEDTRVYGYNYSTQNYDLLFADGSSVMEFSDGCPYIDAAGTIKLRFECSEPYNEFAPKISLIGGNE